MAHNKTFIIFIFLFHLFPLLILSESTCPTSFDCPGIGSMEYPFTSINTQPYCGLFTVNCTNSSRPLLQLEPGGTTSYQILDRVSPNKFFIRDPVLKDLLQRNSCLSFFNRSLPTTSFTSFAISQNFTVFTCEIISNLNETSQYFKSHNCSNFMVYYRNSANTSAYNQSVIPHSCWAAKLPMNPIQHTDNLFEMISSDFTLEWNVSAECMKCHASRGQCTTNSLNDFFCKTADAVRNRTTLITVSALSGAGAAIFFICLLVFLIWLRKKKIQKFYKLSRTISSDPSSSKPDISDGESFYYGIHIFSYKELEEATNNFDSSKELGDGGFGTVYHGKLRDGREVAIKRLFQHNYKRVEQFMNEIKILTCLKHQNLVTLYGCTSRTSSELLLVYEYVRNGTVADHLYKQRTKEAPLTWSARMNIAIEAASALAYLHKSNIVHRDVKTSNILLLDNNFSVKVADFGLSRLFPTDVTHISTSPQGTPGYVDPEYHRCYQLTDKSDVYSFGVVLIELVSSMPAVDIARHRDEINLATFALNRIQRGEFDDLIDSSLGYETDGEIMRMTMSVAELAFQCLQMERDMRPSMDEVSVFLMEIKKGGPEKIPLSPETDEVELLKNMNLKSSPVAITDTWNSASTTTSSID